MLPSLLLSLLSAAALTAAELKHFTTEDDVTYGYDYVAAEDGQPTVLFVHGFPSGRQDWHNQIDNLTAAGYGIIAPDCLGYGESDAPLDVEAYNLKTLAGHMNALLEHEELDSVVGVGHDWGVSVLSSTYVFHPDRFSKLAFLSIPYNPPSYFDVDSLNAQSLREAGYTYYGYWYFFNNYDADEVLTEHLDSYHSLVFPYDPATWRDNFATIGGARAWLTADTVTALPEYRTQEDKEDWMKRFRTREANAAPLNYYRANFAGVQEGNEEGLEPADFALKVPVMTIAGSLDVITPPEQVERGTQPYVAGKYSAEVVESGHWPMLEQAEEVNAYLNAFVSS